MNITIKALAGSKFNKVIENQNNCFDVYLTEIPEKGKANNKIIKLLSEYFKIAKSNIVILKGHKSKIKLIKVFT